MVEDHRVPPRPDGQRCQKSLAFHHAFAEPKQHKPHKPSLQRQRSHQHHQFRPPPEPQRPGQSQQTTPPGRPPQRRPQTHARHPLLSQFHQSPATPPQETTEPRSRLPTRCHVPQKTPTPPDLHPQRTQQRLRRPRPPRRLPRSPAALSPQTRGRRDLPAHTRLRKELFQLSYTEPDAQSASGHGGHARSRHAQLHAVAAGVLHDAPARNGPGRILQIHRIGEPYRDRRQQ
mmetsp:Transcript_5530/g.11511  ORF Transcript_5530/g.11511 Transcript_5530/m.11511 type:complete len:231 (+) Transcript_5530:491-1183(+)